MNKADIYLLGNNLYIKANDHINESYLDRLTQKIISITFSYKIFHIIIDIKNKKLEKKLTNKIKQYNSLYKIKRQTL